MKFPMIFKSYKNDIFYTVDELNHLTVTVTIRFKMVSPYFQYKSSMVYNKKFFIIKIYKYFKHNLYNNL